ncbi:MAG: hypothetical protein WCT18_04750 [Patescibacteria group bacterium]
MTKKNKKFLIPEKKFQKSLLWQELAQNIKSVYPYFLGFYLLTGVFSLIFVSWRGYFYWPAWHGFIIIFTLIYLTNFGRPIRSFLHENGFSWSFLKNVVGFIRKTIRAKIIHLNNVFGEIRKGGGVFTWRLMMGGIVKSQKFLLLILLEIWGLGLFLLNGVRVFLLWFFYKKLKVLGFFIWSKLQKVKINDWVKVVIMVLFLSFAVSQELGFFTFCVLIFGLISVLFVLDSRWSAGGAIFFLAFCPFLIIAKKETLAEETAVFAYYFLIIAVLTSLRELKRDEKVDKDVDK